MIINQDMAMNCHLVQMLEFSELLMRNRTIKYVNVFLTIQMKRETTWEVGGLYMREVSRAFRVISSIWMNSGTNSIKEGRM